MSNDDVKVPYVNETCIGCSACVAICGDVFDLDDDGKAFAKPGMDSSNAE
jgi:ferredoxin